MHVLQIGNPRSELRCSLEDDTVLAIRCDIKKTMSETYLRFLEVERFFLH